MIRLAAAGGRLLSRFRAASLDLLYPPACLGCHTELESQRRAAFCDECLRRVPCLRGATCQKCSAPVPGQSPRPFCPRCAGVKLWFDETIALGEYDGLLRDWLLRMKDASGESLALGVAELIWTEHAERLTNSDFDVVVPVPMHWRRRLERSANAAAILAERLADHLHAPLAAELLRRTRHTRPQFSVPPSQRRANVRNAFAVRSGYHLNGAHVLLVDDILTTGSTASAAARILRSAGAARVTVVVAARTLSH
jgi:ComF family protein